MCRSMLHIIPQCASRRLACRAASPKDGRHGEDRIADVSRRKPVAPVEGASGNLINALSGVCPLYIFAPSRCVFGDFASLGSATTW
jgi:hypothetical protein